MSVIDILFSFQGRIRRTHYWLGTLGASFGFGFLLTLILMVVIAISPPSPDGQPPALFWIIYGLSFIPMLWVGFALSIKRWHDRDKSGWWILIGFIPIIGGIWTLIECGFLDGTPGPNKYGPSPKGIGSAEKVF